MNDLNQLLNLTPEQQPGLTKDQAAALLRISPDAMAAFEQAYAKGPLSNEDPSDFFDRDLHRSITQSPPTDKATDDLIDRIVAELVAQTQVYKFDGKLASLRPLKALPDTISPVTSEEIAVLPQGLRPQLSGNLMKKDTPGDSYPALLYFYDRWQHSSDPTAKQQAYHMFRQGLDILDLDPITYEILSMNRNAMGYWLPHLVNACQDQTFFKIPATMIAKVPMSLLQLSRIGYEQISPLSKRIANQWAMQVFELDPVKDYFVKTGTYSSKFDFRNARVHGEKEVRELCEYLLFLSSQAVELAAPLTNPSIYGASTTNEWVVREFIQDKENNPCIYKGLPLHTEYRVFIDCDKNQVIGLSPYWEPKTMKQRFSGDRDANSPHQIHDYVIYKAHEHTLMKRYHQNKDLISAHVQAILPDLDLTGQWSLDIMQNDTDFWLIDMALAETSAFYTCVPKPLRRPSPENWIPQLPVNPETKEENSP